jgi:hypothetical protein
MGTVISELERMWKEVIVVQLETLMWHLAGKTKKKNEKPQSGWPRFEFILLIVFKSMI